METVTLTIDGRQITVEKGKTVLQQNALQGVGGPPDDLKAFIAGELSKWRPVIESAKISM